MAATLLLFVMYWEQKFMYRHNVLDNFELNLSIATTMSWHQLLQPGTATCTRQ